jgi:activating signal cointegrator 1
VLAISLWQPWASLLVSGHKRVETRSWFPPESVRGRWVAVHGAATRVPRPLLVELGGKLKAIEDPRANESASRIFQGISGLAPRGAVVGLVRFSDFYEVLYLDRAKREATVVEHAQGWNMSSRTKHTVEEAELLLGDWRIGRKLWFVRETIELAEPIACRGRQRLFRLPQDVSAQVRERAYASSGKLVS